MSTITMITIMMKHEEYNNYELDNNEGIEEMICIQHHLEETKEIKTEL